MDIAIYLLLTYIIIFGVTIKVKTNKSEAKNKKDKLYETKLELLKYSFNDIDRRYESLTLEEKKIVDEKSFKEILEEIDNL